MSVTVNVAALLVVASYILLKNIPMIWRIVTCIFTLDVEEERTCETLKNMYQNIRFTSKKKLIFTV